ncbi:MAG: 3-phosphoshikimate 1-carboxyvinyltransferase [Desulfobacteraceae bacterium]|nr:3-phosphoshikimate 1-carboxyvinyltransferase [Desulfobacteraceae bacterium]
MKQIKARNIQPCSVTVPGSKSVSHRMVICAALAGGQSVVDNLLKSEDIELTMAALGHMGASITPNGDNSVTITGFDGRPGPFSDPIYLGNSGTSMRLLAGIAALGESPYILTGDERMNQRPMDALLACLRMADIDAVSVNGNGCPPVSIRGGIRRGGLVTLDCSTSSQYLSSMLMMGAVLRNGLHITLAGPPVSAPYIDLTLDIMKRFQVTAQRITETQFRVPGGQAYVPGHFVVEPDLSNASYFWAAGAVSGSPVKVTGISRKSLQGDLEFVDILGRMGCEVTEDEEGIAVSGNALTAIDVDMGRCPDVVPTLAVVAAFAKGTTRITNIAHLREKECDRIEAVVSQLRKMGIEADQGDDWLTVTGGAPHGASIETFNDHRIAMAFGVAGLKVENVLIENESCVGKSFPTFWEVFETLI